jgi:hypothetical protein
LRARNIKPGTFKNELLAAADPLYTIIFEGLWCLADREGRLEDRPVKIHLEVNPLRPYERTVEALAWLCAQHFIVRYEVGPHKYIAVTEFRKHQQPHTREAKSEIPPPPNQEVVPAPCEAPPRQGSAALIPDSGFLIPDSGLRIPDSSAHGQGEDKAQPRQELPAPRGTSEPSLAAHARWRAHHDWFLEALRPVYPSNLHTDTEWQFAARLGAAILDTGQCSRDRLLQLTAEFAAQQDAKGNRDTQFIESPAKHFDAKGKWKGPFNLPKDPQRATTAQKFDNDLDRWAAERGVVRG